MNREANHRSGFPQVTTNTLPKLSCQKWFDNHIDELRAAGHAPPAESFAVYGAGLERATAAQQLCARQPVTTRPSR